MESQINSAKKYILRTSTVVDRRLTMLPQPAETKHLTLMKDLISSGIALVEVARVYPDFYVQLLQTCKHLQSLGQLLTNTNHEHI